MGGHAKKRNEADKKMLEPQLLEENLSRIRSNQNLNHSSWRKISAEYALKKWLNHSFWRKISAEYAVKIVVEPQLLEENISPIRSKK